MTIWVLEHEAEALRRTSRTIDELAEHISGADSVEKQLAVRDSMERKADVLEETVKLLRETFPDML